MDAERNKKTRNSEIPITERKPAVRLPAEQLDRLLIAVCELTPGQDPEVSVGSILSAAVSFAPGVAFGVRVADFRPLSASPALVVRRAAVDGAAASSPRPSEQSPTKSAAAPPLEGPLFPELACESQHPIEFEPEGVLAIASNDPAALPAGPNGDALISRISLALGAALRASRQLGRRPTSIPPSDDQRRQAVQSDKLAGLGKIVAGVVHELNNPVTSILAYAEYLRRKATRGPLDAADLERIDRIEEAAQRVHGFARQLIAYARPSIDIAVPLVIHDVIDRALLFCEHVLGPSRVTVERAFGRVLPINGIGNQLAQVFVNLFTNAANAMSTTGGTLRIETSLDGDGDGEGEAVHVIVTDTGCGIGEEALPRIFEPFFTTSETGDGTGLGLSIVRDIVEAHRGRVWAERREGAGAAFHVVLPVTPMDD